MPHHSDAGSYFVPTTHHDTYPAIDPTKADLSGKVVLVTGASRGIGKTIAVAFTQAGASGLVLLARGDTEAVEAACLAAQRPGQSVMILPLAVDITNQTQVVMRPGSDPVDWWKVWEVNIRGTYNVSQAFIPLLIDCGGGKLIVSILAHQSMPALSTYQSSKFVVVRVTESIVADYGPQGIIAFAVHPCGTPTDMNAHVPPEIKKPFIDTPELAAHTMVWLVRERREWLSARYVSCEWDVEELLAKKEDIIEGDKLKFRMIV
ncbi:Short chain dehydrogenase citE [Sparassis crispa]|uniref:Short chain dehydrogenase citE n=1 Tax=Sparassis crispa TaxID=139825 RepID=A0A401H5R2_9APHY|nr:Short chain dehydrogenase citE [Sparassis crispa]GBE89719.1 Short chain dehydrogenase citE [Sparassis crispa]